MKVLVIGGGGREHAICLALSKSDRVSELFCAPGNPGIAEISENIRIVDIQASNIEGLAEFAVREMIDFTVVGPDEPLSLGITDVFKSKGLRIFGPDLVAAEIEYSKAFAKDFMKRNGIPTAAYEIFSDYVKAVEYVRTQPLPIVIKADGLALGKGVVICESHDEAVSALKEAMVSGVFGSSGNTVVIEEFMDGVEISVLSFCDGKTIVPMVEAQDHKRANDGDAGPNTGGMGTYSPCGFYTETMKQECMELVFKSTMDALINEGRPFVGIIFFGLMLTKNGPKVIEYNARFGDPETQVVLTRLDTDLLDIFEACVDGKLNEIEIKWKEESAVCVIAASGGYPGAYQKGLEITGIDKAVERGAVVYHAGTAQKDGCLITNGGRVLGITATGRDFNAAKDKAYEAIKCIHFDGMYYRKDIGHWEEKNFY